MWISVLVDLIGDALLIVFIISLLYGSAVLGSVCFFAGLIALAVPIYYSRLVVLSDLRKGT